MNNLVDFLHLIPNLEEHNLEILEKLYITMWKYLDQCDNTVGLEFYLDVTVDVTPYIFHIYMIKMRLVGL